jgi:phage host-nuclease inhibitor protein Gam
MPETQTQTAQPQTESDNRPATVGDLRRLIGTLDTKVNSQHGKIVQELEAQGTRLKEHDEQIAEIKKQMAERLGAEFKAVKDQDEMPWYKTTKAKAAIATVGAAVLIGETTRRVIARRRKRREAAEAEAKALAEPAYALD